MKFIVTVQQSSLLCLTCIYIKCRPPRLDTGRHLCLSNGFEKRKRKESQNVNSFYVYILWLYKHFYFNFKRRTKNRRRVFYLNVFLRCPQGFLTTKRWKNKLKNTEYVTEIYIYSLINLTLWANADFGVWICP